MAEIGAVPGFCYVVADALRLKHRQKKMIKARESGDFDLERKLIWETAHEWGTDVMNHFDTHVNIINPENIPQEGPVVYISNHQSYFDMFSLFSIIPHQFNFIAKKEWGKIPFFGPFIQNTRGILIDRGNMRQTLEVINQGSEYVREGFSMAIFPEGTRSKGHEMGPMKAGSYKLATKAEAKIVPITIDGSFKVFEEKGKFVTGQTINFIFHEAIDTAGLDRKAQNEIIERVDEIIKEGLEQLRRLDEAEEATN